VLIAGHIITAGAEIVSRNTAPIDAAVGRLVLAHRRHPGAFS